MTSIEKLTVRMTCIRWYEISRDKHFVYFTNGQMKIGARHTRELSEPEIVSIYLKAHSLNKVREAFVATRGEDDNGGVLAILGLAVAILIYVLYNYV